MPAPVDYTQTERYRTFLDADAWNVSKRNPNNIVRDWRGCTVIVFVTNNYLYSWLVINKQEKTFSPDRFGDIESAIEDVAHHCITNNVHNS